ncbi:hypothetical protein C8R47DRAFT_1082205 [Mycena vitilis]|nr:hypothetical protein C8R47DRAFT_1082205 [Mycena vitilis]
MIQSTQEPVPGADLNDQACSNVQLAPRNGLTMRTESADDAGLDLVLESWPSRMPDSTPSGTHIASFEAILPSRDPPSLLSSARLSGAVHKLRGFHDRQGLVKAHLSSLSSPSSEDWDDSNLRMENRVTIATVLSLLVLAVGIGLIVQKFGAQLIFVYHCFFRRVEETKGDQKSRLDKFYEGQAEVYDATRGGLLRGRKTMIALSGSHLHVLRAAAPNARLVWVDVGGRTGRNIEVMDDYFPVSNFDAIYLVDLCGPLLQVARERFAKRGWHNITVLCQDATAFWLPDWSEGQDPRGSVDFVTMSYSVTMIPKFYQVLDRVHLVLAPETGLFGVADFYTAGKQDSLIDKSIGGVGKECGWFRRWFWQFFFELDHLYLSAEQRTYLEYRFGTIKSFSGKNQFAIPHVVQIPYFSWLGRPRFSSDVPLDRSLEMDYVLSENPGVQIDIDDVQLTSFHYSIAKCWRLPYFDDPTHSNSLAFRYHSPIHCVDIDPRQNHLLELKMAAIQSLEYDDFFAMFGEGRHPAFPYLLDSKIAPYLSSAAYHFWKMHHNTFASSFYLNGQTGQALSVLRFIFGFAGVSKDVIALCDSDTLVEQESIWRTKLRPVLLNPAVSLLLRSPALCWKVLGIPPSVRKLLMKDGGVSDYVQNTLDPLVSTYLLKTENYFYLMALLGNYTSQSCPEGLTRSGFERLKANNGQAMESFRLHTKSAPSALRSQPTCSLTHVILTHDLDWFPDTSTELDHEIAEIYRVLHYGGSVFWRSAVRSPLYNRNFQDNGFDVTALNVRTASNLPVDRVNAHASFFKATKPKRDDDPGWPREVKRG